MLKQWRVTYQVKHIITKEVVATKHDTVAALDEGIASTIVGLRVLENGYTYKLLKIEDVTHEQPTNGHSRSSAQ